jgi:hypothetical protein
VTLPMASLILRHMNRASGFSAYDAISSVSHQLVLSPEESLIGLYVNPPPHADRFVAFTQEAIYKIEGEDVTRIAFSEIVDYKIPDSKSKIKGVWIITKRGCHFVYMAGSYGPDNKFKDVFSLISVLHVVVRNAAKSGCSPQRDT